MKKYLILLLAATVALVSCNNEIPGPENGNETIPVAPVTFNLTANHPDATKAVKSGWESGDAIFVFFSGATSPNHLKMTFDGTSWTSVEYDGATPTPGALGLKNGDTGTMRAIFLPFGSAATVSANGTDFTFSKTYYAYYLTATLEYTVTDNKVSGAFNMVIPDDYVQFFVEDATATDEGYSLGTDAVKPVGVAYIASDGTVQETSNKSAGEDMPGYAYQGGYLFSGKLSGIANSGNYYFAKTKTDDNSRADYFVSGSNTLSSHSAVKLPANDNIYEVVDGVPNEGKWVPAGNDVTVELFGSDLTSSLGKWYTCNYNQSVPEAVGSTYRFSAANDLGITLPTKEQFELIDSSCDFYPISVRGRNGQVVKAARGFLYLPYHDSYVGGYWSSTEDSDINYAWSYYIDGPVHKVSRVAQAGSFAVRQIDNSQVVVDLSAEETANTYIVSSAGQYKFKATVKGNGGLDPMTGTTATTIDPASIVGVKVLWELGDTYGKAIKYEGGAYDISYADGYVYFSTPDSFSSGDACVAIYDSSDNILWSWVIWATPAPGTTTHKGATFMDRNLGAIDVGNCMRGFLYQWGRKDAFSAANGNNYSPYTYVPDHASIFSEVKVTSTMDYTIAHPTVGVNTGDATSWMSSEDYAKLPWRDDVKTIYDPCPAGWRVPTSTQMNGMSGLPATGFCNVVGLSGISYRGYGNPGSCYYRTSTISSYPRAYAFNGSGISNWGTAPAMAIRPVHE